MHVQNCRVGIRAVKHVTTVQDEDNSEQLCSKKKNIYIFTLVSSRFYLLCIFGRM